MQQWKQVAGAGALVALTVLPVSTTLCAVWCAPAAGSTTTGIVTGSSAAHHGSGTATREASDHRRLPVGARSGNDCGETHEAAREAPATSTSSGAAVGVVLSFELAVFPGSEATFSDVISRSPAHGPLSPAWHVQDARTDRPAHLIPPHPRRRSQRRFHSYRRLFNAR